MSNIDKQALREMAERAASDGWGYDRDEFNDAITPDVVLALLDELEAAEKRIADGENRIRKQNRHVCELFDDNTALRQRIIELEEKLQTADKLQDSAFRHGLQHGFSLGQTDNQAGFEQAIQAYGQQWKGE